MSTVPHGVKVMRSSARYMVTGEYIISSQMGSVRSVTKTKMIKSSVWGIPRKNAGRFVDGCEVAPEEEGSVDKSCSDMICYQHGSLFKRLSNCLSNKE